MSTNPTFDNPDAFRFKHTLRVRWAEVDMQKIVFNAHYLMYIDTGIADYWRALALPYESAMHALGGDLYVKKATVEYHASARMDDRLDVALRCTRIGNSSITFTGVIFRGDERLITAELIYVFADPATQTSRPVPAILRRLLEDFEQGGEVIDIEVASWSVLQEDARQIRTEVFVEEQGIPKDLEWDQSDAHAVHAIVRNRLGQVLATGRLLQASPGVGQIGRMAVQRVMRSGGWGRRVALALIAAARARGDHEVMLHAQHSAVGFYRRLGFSTRGEPFDEVGIAHQEMVLELGPRG